MIKTKFMTIVLAVAMILGTVTAFAAPTLYDGSNIVSASHRNLTSKVSGLAGKLADDVVYSSGMAGNNCGLRVSANYNGAPVTAEFAFLVPDGSSGVKIHPNIYTSANLTKYDEFSNYLVLEVNKKIGNGPVMEHGKWYTMALLIPSDGSRYVRAYVNGEDVGELKVSTPTYGVRWAYVGSADSDDTVYLDNAKAYIDSSRGGQGNQNNSAAFDAELLKSSKITISAPNYSVNNDTIIVPENTKISDLKNVITTTDGTDDVVRVYTDSTLTQIADDSSVALGTVVVVAAKNGTSKEMAYSYYNVEEPEKDTDVLKGKDASDVVVSNTASPQTTVSLANGNYGKEYSDSVYKVISKNTSAQIRFAPSINSNGSLTFVKGAIGVTEFSFCMPENSGGFSFGASTVYTKNSNTGLPTITVTSDGIFVYEKKCCDIEPNTWYSFAIEVAKDGSTGMNLYLNGKNIYTYAFKDAYGFRTSVIILTKANDDVLYLDNISASESYTNENNLPAVVNSNNISARDGKLYALNGTTAFDITLAKGEALRLYNADWTTANSLAEAEIAVFAAKNNRSIERTLTYYDVEMTDCVIDYSVISSDGTTTLDTDVYSLNHTTLFVAYYSSFGESKVLDGVISVPAVLNNGVYTVSAQDIAMTSGYTYVVYAWSDADNTITPLTKPVVVK